MSTNSDVLSTLLYQRNEWVTGEELSAHFGVSTRTIRNWTRGRADITSSPRGYRHVPDHHVAASSVASPAARARQVLLNLLDAVEGTSIYALAERYFVSDLTVDADLHRVRRMLAATGLHLERIREHVRLVGSERQRRALLRRSRDYRRHPRFQDTSQAFRRELRAHGYAVNGLALDDAIAAILIAVTRHGTTPIDAPTEAGPLPTQGEPEDTTASGSRADDAEMRAHLRRVIHGVHGVTLAEAELDELIPMLRVVATPRPTARPDSAVRAAVGAALRRVGAAYAIELTDRELIDRLSRHVIRMRSRPRADNPRNALTAEVKRAYPMLFDIAVRLAQDIAPTKDLARSADEQAYLALHLGSAVQPATRDRVRIAVRAPEYHDIVDQLAIRLATHTDADVTRELADPDAEPPSDHLAAPSPDLLVIAGLTPRPTESGVPSTPSGPDRHGPDAADAADTSPSNARTVRTVQVDLMPSDTDLARVHAAVLEVRQARARARLVATLLDALEPAFFVRGFPPDGADGVIRALTTRLATAGVVDPSYAEDILTRERLSSTVFADHVAVPHALTLSATRTAIAVALDEHPMDWNGEPVKLVVLVAFPGDHGAGFREFFDALVQVVSDPAHVNRIVRAAHRFEDFVADLTEIFAAHDPGFAVSPR